MSNRSGRTAAWLAGALAAGLAWRLLLALVVVPAWEAETGIAQSPDAYPSLARSLLEDGVLGYGSEGASPTTVRGPGFPAWLALGILAGGARSWWLGLWGGLPGVLAGAWVAALVAREHGAPAAVVAWAVAVLHPLPSLIAARGMGDDFYAALGFGALALWVGALRETRSPQRLGWTVACGLLLAVQMLSRASGILTLLVALGLAGAGLAARNSGPERSSHGIRRGRIATCALLVAVALPLPLAWSLRSSRLEGRPVFVHSLGAYNFWIGEGFDRFGAGDPPSGNYPSIVRFALSQAGPGFDAARFTYRSLTPGRAAELDGKLAQAARDRIAADPVGYAARVARGVPAYWFRAQTSRRTLQYALVVAPVLLLAAIGVSSAARSPLGLQLLAALALHNLAYAAVLPAARMSVQVYPALAFLAGAGVSRLARGVRGS